MFNFCHSTSQLRPTRSPLAPLQTSFRILSSVLVLGVVSGVSLFAGFTPGLHPQLGTPAYAQPTQTVTDEEAKSYARAVFSIEPIREAAFAEIKKNMGAEDVPAIACNKPDTVEKLPTTIRTIAVNYCNKSKQIVEQSGLTTARFNVITVTLSTNPDLVKRIQAEITLLRKPPATP